MNLNLRRLHPAIREADLYKKKGRVTDVAPQLIQGHLPDAQVGSLCQISSGAYGDPCLAEV
ncbi:flagellum-specific ATP synthase FliI, partial [bacterium]|nr:flagellum-specific ATP synthase FliI [bacterium]